MHLRATCLLTLLLVAHAASGRSIDLSPRPVALLADGSFVAQETPTGVALYNPAGKAVARFDAGGPVTQLAVTADGAHAAVACADGSVAVGDLRSGQLLWRRAGDETAIGHAYDASFAGDGRSLVVAGSCGEAAVFSTTDGRPLGHVRFPSGTTSVMSAALSPDGSTGVLVELGGRVHFFDVATGQLGSAGVTGAWPVRYSADGRFVALRNCNSGTDERLRVFRAADPSSFADVGEPGYIGHVRPLPDGRWAVTASVVRQADPSSPCMTVGWVCRPDGTGVEQVWEVGGHRLLAAERTDFDPVRKVGVWTDFALRTRVVDLAGASVRFTVDNSANRRMIEDRPDRPECAVRLATTAVVLGAALILAIGLLLRRRRSRSAAT